MDLWLWPKSQNFQNRLVPLSFSSTFRFWDPFLHSKLGNCANVQFPESWLFHKSWPKVKIFKPDLSCPIFHVDSNFEVYFFIWESKIAQIVWFYSCWLWCELWPRIKMSEQSLSHSVFCEDSDFESTYLFRTWKPPIRNFEIHPFSLDSFRVILRLHQGFPFKEQWTLTSVS